MSCTFSILVCSLNRRHLYLDKLLACLHPQLQAVGYPNDPTVELLIEKDDGELAIGAKRNKLLQRAKGKFIAFVDDDDLVADSYVRRILDAIQTKPQAQVVGISLIMTTNGAEPQNSYHSIEHRSWWDRIDPSTGRKIYYRNPNHLNPVLRELALKVGFPSNSSHGEDRDYSMRLLPLLTCEIVIPEPIYFYLNRWPKDC